MHNQELPKKKHSKKEVFCVHAQYDDDDELVKLQSRELCVGVSQIQYHRLDLNRLYSISYNTQQIWSEVLNLFLIFSHTTHKRARTVLVALFSSCVLLSNFFLSMPHCWERAEIQFLFLPLPWASREEILVSVE